jgi:sugar (pentulose or hexulose) kinase
MFDNEQTWTMPVASLGIDLGTTNTKVALVALDAPAVRVHALATAPTPEPRDLGAVLATLIREVLAGAAPPDAVGIASMAETGVPLAADGTPIGGWLRWTGHRAGAEADALANRLGWADLVAATGVRPSAKVPLATWAWLRTHRPEVWDAMSRWAGVADLAAFVLTGRLITDHTLAGRTMAYRLPATAEAPPTAFDGSLLAEVGLRPHHLPAVTSEPVAVTGFAGLRDGTPVVVAGHDHAVGAYACGVREPGDVADSLGTAEAVLTVVEGEPDPVAAGRAGMSVVVTVGGRYRAVLAGQSSAGAAVEWWLANEAAGVTREELFADLPDGPTGVLVLPYVQGRQTPAPDPAARLRVVGREPAHGRAVLAKALLEGLSLHTRWMLDEQARIAGGAGAPAVFLFGGAVAGNPDWTRIKAQVLPGTLRVVPAAEPVAVGAALLAAVRAGLVGPPGPALTAEPAPAGAKPYDDMYDRFVRAAQENG